VREYLVLGVKDAAGGASSWRRCLCRWGVTRGGREGRRVWGVGSSEGSVKAGEREAVWAPFRSSCPLLSLL
jgi:hypothetical protein